MYRSVLVPLDGTWYGEHALPVARGIARRFGATLHLVHVHTEVAVPVAVESLPFLDAHMPLRASQEQRAYLDGLAAALADHDVQVTTDLVEGPLTDSLARYAVERGADLVVACTHCHEGLSRFWHRGVGEQILHDISIPLLLNRSDDTRPDLADERSFRHVLVPLNGSRFAEEILDRVVPLGLTLGAHVTLLRVVRPMALVGQTLFGQDTYVSTFVLEEQQKEALAYVDDVAAGLRDAGLGVSTRVVSSDDPGRSIVEATRLDDETGLPPVDLIAMTTHCRGPLTRVVLSSITDAVLHNSPVPLLLHHPLTEEPDAGPALAGLGREANSTG